LAITGIPLKTQKIQYIDRPGMGLPHLQNAKVLSASRRDGTQVLGVEEKDDKEK